MATRNLVPRTGSQGQLGTDTKPWKKHIAASGSFEIISGSLTPDADSTYDLGSSGKEWKDLYIDGTANVDSLTLTSGATVTAVLDEDAMGSDSATSLATQQSIKAYVDSKDTAQDLDFQGDSGGALSIDLDSETLDIAGDGAGISTAGSGNQITISGDHDALTNFVANEHIDHSSVSISAGGILSGGGTIASTRTITLASSDVVHDSTTGFVANEHIDHSGVTLTAGTGLSGGGTIAASRTFTVDLNELTTETSIADTDFIAMVDATDDGSGKITFENLEDAIFSSVSGDILITEAGVSTIQANSVALTTDTTGNYVATITGGTSITSTAATSGEGTTHSLSVDDVFVRNDGNDTSSGTITAAGFTTTATGSFGRIEATHISASNIDVDASTLTVGGETLDETLLANLQNTSGTNTGDQLVYKNVASDSGTAVADTITDTLTIAGGEGIDTSASGDTITITGEEASTSNKGVASFNSDNFSVSSGVVTIKDDGVILGTETTGNYVGTITGGTGITSTAATSGEGTTHSLSVDAAQTQITSVGTIGTGTWQGTTIAVNQGGTGVTTKTGTGNVVLSSSPTLVTPALGTPASGVMTNVTGTASSLTAGKTTVTDSTANTAFPIILHDESNALLDDTGTFTYNPSTSTLVVPNINVSGTQTFVNTASLVVTSSIIFEGATDDGHETTLTVVDPTGDNTWTLPNATDTVVGKATTDTLTNKTLTSPTITGTGNIAGTFTGDISGDVTGNADTSTKISSITNSNIVQLTSSQTLTNKTLTSPTLTGPILGTPASGTMTNVNGTSGITGLGTQSQDLEMGGQNIQTAGVITLKEQAEADADVAGEGQLWVDTATPNVLYFTNDAGTDHRLNFSTSAHLRGMLSDETGTGGAVFATSPTLTTPALGTPSALVLTNATALPAAQVSQGTMASGMVLVAPALGTPASGVMTNVTGTASSLNIGGTAALATSVTVSANNSTDESVYPVFTDGATGTQGLESDTGLSYNPSTGVLTVGSVVGGLEGSATSITVTAVTDDDTVFPVFTTTSSGANTPEVATGLTFNPSSGLLTTTTVAAALTGNASTATKISSITNSNIVQLTSSQTLTNKTLTSPVLTTPNVGTPSALVGTNISGTAANLTVGATTGVEAGADVTDTTNVTSAGALMDSEVTDLDGIKSLTVPNSTTISTFGASLVDDAAASNARTTLGLGSMAVLSAIDISANTNLAAGTNISLSGDTLNVDDAFLVNDASDTTSGTITAAGFTTTGTWTFDEFTSGTIGITTVQDSGTGFDDNDTSLMTAAAVADKIEDYGYTTETGDITGVTAGTGMSGGGTSGTVTLTNAGVTSNVAGTGISVSGATGAVTVTNSGVTSVVAGDGIDVSGATGAVTVTVEDSTASNKGSVIVAGGTGISVGYSSGTATVTGHTKYALTEDLAASEITAIQNIGAETITATQWGYLGASSGAITNTNTTYLGGTNLTLSGTTFNVDDAFLKNNADDTTSGNITVGGITIGGHSIADIDIGGEFNDVDDHLMTSAAVQDKILGYSYSTTTGTVTNVATAGTVSGITLTGGAITSTGTITLGGTIDLASGDIPNNAANTSGKATTAGTADLATTVTVTDSTANTNFPVVFNNESSGLLDDTGALRYNPSTGTLLVPNLTVAGTTTQVDTVTMEAANAVIFEGATANDFETTLTITDPTADRTVTLQNKTGTVALTSDITGTNSGTNTGDTSITDGTGTTSSTTRASATAVKSAYDRGSTGITNAATAQTTANAALPKSGGAMTGAITTNSTFDGVDIATRDGVLTSTTTTAGNALPKAGGTMSGDIAMGGNDISGGGDITGTFIGNVTGNTSGTAATVTTAAQTAITSLGTLTALQVDNLNINGNTISSTSGVLNITPVAGQYIALDSTIAIDAGVVTGATSITSTAFVVGGHSVNDIDITSEASNADDHLMTALAIQNRIEDYGYSTTTGTVTSVTAGTGMTQSGTSTVNPTLNVIGGTGITANANDIAITADSVGDTQLAYNTGQHLTTTSDVTFNDFRADSIGVGLAATSTTGRIDATNDVVAFSSSDKRWKENIIRISNPLEKIGKIGGYEFDWKELTEEEKKTQHGNTGHDVGVIAQEIQEVLPEVVKERDNGYLGVDYEKIVPLLIEAIKEQQKQIDELKKNKMNKRIKE